MSSYVPYDRSRALSTTLGHRREHDEHPYDYRRPSPPPIATLSHSPSLSASSVERSSVSSPPRRSPTSRPLDSHSSYSDPYYAQDHSARQSRPYPHDPVRDSERSSHSYSYASRTYPDYRHSHDNTYTHPPAPSYTSSFSHGSLGTRDAGSLSYPLPGQNNYTIGYTDDASTKLSDKVRRRCFNCHTTDTSTWRRSNLSPGKVLCNKCGLFERTHGRSRPDQFPHRRGPLATTTLPRPKSPPQSTQLPPISTHTAYHYNRPSIPPLTSIPESRGSYHSHQLPDIHSWIDAPPRTSTVSMPSSYPSDHRSGHIYGQSHDSSPLRPRSPPRMQHQVDMRSSSIHEAVA
ncbi:hypothetical protein EDC04DRAFT_2561351 [Pisolithus marmoratus]|nr:hypothetical protein EDC04DRAFT_2561351 [Pisolithus marmoratus]